MGYCLWCDFVAYMLTMLVGLVVIFCVVALVAELADRIFCKIEARDKSISLPIARLLIAIAKADKK